MSKLRVFLVNVGRSTVTYPFTVPPMGILYLAGHLRTQFDVDIRLVNQRLDNCSTDDLAAQAAAFGADVVGFTVMTTTAYVMPDLTRRVRESLPSALIVLGGPHVTAFREQALADTAADAAVVGEGETAFEQIIREHFFGGSLSGIPGLIWREDGQVVTNPGRLPLIDDLDALAFPAYDLIDLKPYWRRQSLAPFKRRKYASLVTSRGCPYKCMWCHDVFGKSWRAHSPERIADEIAHYQRTWGVEEVEFLDDVFNLSRKRVVELCELVQRRGLNVKMACPNGVRTDILTRDVVDALVDAGLYYSSFALETGSPRLQAYTGKRLDIPKFLNGVEMMARRGVFTYGVAMLGHPTETEPEIRQTIETLSESALHLGTYFTVTPFPRTRLYDVVQERSPERLAGLQYDDADFVNIRVNLSDVPDEVLFAHQRKAARRFYMNPRRIYRIIRDYPQRHVLPAFLPILLDRMTKGSLARAGRSQRHARLSDGPSTQLLPSPGPSSAQ